MNNISDTNPVFTRIHRHYSLMSIKERRVADYIMSDLESVTTLPVAQIAKNAQASPATVVRFTNSIGFSGVAEFKNYLRSELFSSNGTWSAFDPSDSFARIAVKTMDYNKRAIDETLMVLKEEAVSAAVQAIEKANRLIIFTEGASGCSAQCAYDAFLQIGVRCSIVTDPFCQVMEVAQMTKQDVAFAVCHSGRARNSVDAIRLAKKAGATTISVVGTVGSPITKSSDIILYTGLADNSFHSETMAVRICELNVISVLHTALTLRKQEALGDYRSRNSQLFELKRYEK